MTNKNIDELFSEYVPEGSTVDRELNFLTKQWNRMISKDAYNNLTEDVNSLIRDYTRRVCNTLTAQTFTKERIENLADALVRTPNMQKITEPGEYDIQLNFNAPSYLTVKESSQNIVHVVVLEKEEDVEEPLAETEAAE